MWDMPYLPRVQGRHEGGAALVQNGPMGLMAFHGHQGRLSQRWQVIHQGYKVQQGPAT